MKNKMLLGCLALGAALWLTGCGDSGDQASPPAPTPPKEAKPAPAPEAPKPPAEAPKPAAEAPKPVVKETEKAVEAVKTQAAEAAKVVQTVATDAAAAAQKKFNDLVAEVKTLLAEGKGTEALQKLQGSISGMKLSTDQQSIVDTLKKQVQDSMAKKGAEAATKAVGDLFKPKK